MQNIPVTYQEISDFFGKNQIHPFILRRQTLDEIERIIGMPLVCYVSNPNAPKASIEEEDITGFNDLIYSVEGDSVGIFIISNGGSPSAAERIVKLIREKFTRVFFYVAGNAYSAATMMCFSGDGIVMLNQGTLGPIDPQINGRPAYAILKSFEEIQEKLKKEGPAGIAAYMPLIAKFDLTLLEICKNAQQLSEELARQYLTQYMFANDCDNQKIDCIVDFFLDYGIHKTHGRSIDRNVALEKGLKIQKAEEIDGLAPLLLSLHNQYRFFLQHSPFVKLFENSQGINWGIQPPAMNLPLAQIPQHHIPAWP